ncbi:MAG: MHYT domain-containing protein [Gemmatimonadaceae bacterium]
MTGTYDPAFVGLSVVIAMLASYAALDLAGRVTSSAGPIRLGWLAGGATVMGLGIWSMHFIGMLAFHLPVPIAYDVPLMLLSVAVAIGASLVALSVVSQPKMGSRTLIMAGLMMGVAIAGMHYIGMASMRLDALLDHDDTTVFVSILIAICASLAALWLAFHLRSDRTLRAFLLRTLSAAVMGIAISGMHYTAMSGAHFQPQAGVAHSDHNIIASGYLGAAVAAGTVLILLLALIGAVIDRNIQARIAFTNELREKSEALREGEQRYRELFDDIPVGLYRSTPAGAFIEVNRALVSLLGYPDRDTLLSTPIKSLYVDSEERERWTRAMEELGLVRDFEVRMRRMDGAIVTLRDTSHAHRSPDGAVIRYEGALEDVTERKRLEERLRHASKMEAVGQLAGGVAHDFNNLLMAIRGNTDLLLEDAPNDESVTEGLREIRKAAERATTLTSQLLAFSRRQILQPRVVNLNSIIAGMQDLLARLISEHIEVVTDLGDGLGEILVDPSQVEQVILNLAVNARDAMPDGGVLTFATANRELDDDDCPGVTDFARGSYIELAVRDTGTGIPPEVLPHIFEPFFTTKPLGKGTGLGLATVYGVVEQSGGHISVESKPGYGTRFKVVFPRSSLSRSACDEREGNDGCPTERIVSQGGQTILLVEDEPMVRLITTKILSKMGFNVLEAEAGDVALRMAAENPAPIDLVITDVVMPRMRGPELVRQMRERNPRMRVIYISGYNEEGITGLGALDSATLFLQKPFTTEGLADIVRKALSAVRSAA